MRTKLRRAIARASIPKGPRSLPRLLGMLPKECLDGCSATILARVMEAIHRAYRTGVDASGAIMIDERSVWIAALNAAIAWTEDGDLHWVLPGEDIG